VIPFASGATVWLLPLIVSPLMMFASSSTAVQESMREMSTKSLVAVEGGILLLSMLLVSVGMALATAFYLSRHGAAMVRRAARAVSCDRSTELELHRVVENLCIGAGLPKPEIFVIESTTPNAFATGRDPEDAAIIVSRGLLTLLDRRELEAVIAHELSHIGNQDIALNTTLAALIGTLTIPLTFISRLFRIHRIITVFGSFVLLQVLGGFALLAGLLLSGELDMPPFLVWWSLHALMAPFYVVLIAPLIGRGVQRAVAREREFLADADAVLLTRNPEALATALLKVDAATGTPIRVGPATEHLYFVDPLTPDAPWLAKLFRTHPPVAERVELLASMGTGIPASVRERILKLASEWSLSASHSADEPDDWRPAVGAGAMALTGISDPTPVGAPRPPAPLPESIGAPASEPEPSVDPADLVVCRHAPLGEPLRVCECDVPLYERPDGWSRVVDRLERGSVVTARGREEGFLRVSTGEGVVGYLGWDLRLAVVGDGEGV
jgi:heat shock protein HtpX